MVTLAAMRFNGSERAERHFHSNQGGTAGSGGEQSAGQMELKGDENRLNEGESLVMVTGICPAELQ